MKEQLESWFADTRESYAKAMRFAFFIVAFVLLIHVTTFQQYLRTQAGLRSAKANLDTNRIAQAKVQQIVKSVETLGNVSTQQVPALLAELVHNLTNDFALLGQQIDAVLHASTEHDSTLQVQGPVRSTGIPLPDELKDAIRRHRDIELVRKDLKPWIQTNLIAPRFEAARYQWSSALLPAV